MKKDDYLSVKCMDNGFLLELNSYASDKGKRRVSVVARSAEEACMLTAKLVLGEPLPHELPDPVLISADILTRS